MIDQCEAMPAARTSTRKELAMAFGSAAALYYLYTLAVLALNASPPALPPLAWVAISCVATVGYLLIIVYAIRLLARLALTRRQEVALLGISLAIFLGLNPLVWQAIALLREGVELWNIFAALTVAEEHSLLASIVPFFLVLTGVFFGRLIARVIRETAILLPVALVSGLIDFWGVYWGPVSVMSENAPAAVGSLGSATTAIAEVPAAAFANLPAPMLVLAQLTPPESIGLGDFVFIALFLTCAYRLGFSAKRLMWGVFVGLLLASFIMALDGQTLFGHDIVISYLPGLVFICAGVLLADIRQWRLTRQEWLMTGAIVLLLAALISYSIFTATKSERDDVISYTLPASGAREAIAATLAHLSDEMPDTEILPVALHVIYLTESADPRAVQWEALLLARKTPPTLRDTQAFHLAGQVMPDDGNWHVDQRPLSSPLRALSPPRQDESADDLTRIGQAQGIPTSALSLLDRADEYAKFAGAQRFIAIRLLPDGGSVLDPSGAEVKALTFTDDGK